MSHLVDVGHLGCGVRLVRRSRHTTHASRPERVNLSQVERLAALGLNKGQIALAVGLHRQAFTTDAAGYDRALIDEAIDRGRAKGTAAVAAALVHNATKKGSVEAQKFYLQARGGKHFRTDQHATDASLPAALESMDLADLELQVTTLRARVHGPTQDVQEAPGAVIQGELVHDDHPGNLIDL